MKLIHTIRVAVLAAGVCTFAEAARADCKLVQTAEFRVDPKSPQPIVQGEINGQPVRILFDTGAATSVVPASQAKRLGVTMSRLEGARMYGFGGATAAYEANIKDLKIGALKVGDLRLVVAGDQDATSDVSLLLGDDFFSRTNVEFDLGKGIVRLFEAQSCTPPQLVYWGQAYSQTAILPSNRDAPKTQTMATINGKQILAEFDTGAYASTIDETAAEAAGVTLPESRTAEAGHGLGPRPTASWVAHFDSLAIGDEKLSNIRLRVENFAGGWVYSDTGTLIPRQLGSTPYLFIGADFFHAHRIFIDNQDHLILFSYEGGPVFTQPPAARPADAPK